MTFIVNLYNTLHSHFIVNLYITIPNLFRCFWLHHWTLFLLTINRYLLRNVIDAYFINRTIFFQKNIFLGAMMEVLFLLTNSRCILRIVIDAYFINRKIFFQKNRKIFSQKNIFLGAIMEVLFLLTNSRYILRVVIDVYFINLYVTISLTIISLFYSSGCYHGSAVSTD